MENCDKISLPLNVHSLNNPPSPSSATRANINISNQKHITITNWKSEDTPSFVLEITDPLLLGLSNFEESTVNKFMESVILACNLEMKKASFSRHNSNSSHPSIQRKKENPILPKEEETPTGKKITFFETVHITDSVSITMRFEDKIDENNLNNILKRIQNLPNTHISNLITHELQKSLNEFYLATTNFERVSIFKHLYTSIELAVNSDGKNRRGPKLDEEINKLSGLTLTQINEFRNFNNSLKHLNKFVKHRNAYQEGMKNLGTTITTLRNASQTIILDKLNHIS